MHKVAIVTASRAASAGPPPRGWPPTVAANRMRDGGGITAISSGQTVVVRPASGLYATSKAAGDQMHPAM